MTHRPTIYGTRHAVSAGHYLAAAAGFSILEAGGNAIDAGCAAGIALGVLQPDLVNVAGVAPIMIRLRERHVESIAGLGLVAEGIARRPVHARARRQDPRRRAAHRGAGRARRLDHRAAPPRHDALRRCRAPGDPLRRARASRCIRCWPRRSPRTRHEYRRWPSNAAIFLPNGRVPNAGRKLRADRPGAHAAIHGRPGRAPPARGSRWPGWPPRTTRSIAATSRARSSLPAARRRLIRRWRTWRSIRSRDRAGRCGARWRGHELITCGPWCQGPALLQALALVERVGIDGLEHNSADYLHRIVEAVNLAIADREYYLRRSRLRRRADRPPADRRHTVARPRRRRCEMTARSAEDAAAARPPQPRIAASRGGLPRVEADTSYCCVVDRWGNAFSATPSDGSWQRAGHSGLGIVPSARGSQSRPDPRHPAGVAPGKRPRLTPNPAMR